MNVFGINSSNISSIDQSSRSKVTPGEAQEQFSTLLKESINKVNDSQIESDVLTEKMARGEQVDLHNVLITSKKASIMLSTTLEIRNKAIEAYQEIMRMQV
ncbi:flagellar hook-basal body complex protein FliE [Bacillus massiliigorillae]|uniref:flagellar hook-basal body complex protein FliE n=1 Tax=Bacillus massiliigorillae TaxID=1243664 RepID=UPI000399CC0A|nr:flagellar hook-basal body complex protein FliE [Bacillus massiliigorillae]